MSGRGFLRLQPLVHKQYRKEHAGRATLTGPRHADRSTEAVAATVYVRVTDAGLEGGMGGL